MSPRNYKGVPGIILNESGYHSLAYEYGDGIVASIQSVSCNSPEMMGLINLSVDEMAHDGTSTGNITARMQIALASAVNSGLTASVQTWNRFYHQNS